jgi:hypothetical protein
MFRVNLAYFSAESPTKTLIFGFCMGRKIYDFSMVVNGPVGKIK